MSTENKTTDHSPTGGLLQTPMTWRDYMRSLGPGILLAGAAIGGSHLFQSTRAGANFGWGLVWAVALANILKYPFFDYAIRYQAATGQNLLQGFKAVHPALLSLSLVVVFLSGALNISALTIGSGVLLSTYLAPLFPNTDAAVLRNALCVAVIVASFLIIMVGRYRVLDLTTKIIISLLSASTIIAFFIALAKGSQAVDSIPESEVFITANIGFMLALMGWMPLPIDASIWPTVWSCEKAEQEGHRLSLREQLFDFNFGYISAAVLAFFFLGLGALVLYRTGNEFSPSNIGFANQLMDIYGKQFGDSAKWLIGIAAATALFSSALTCYDAYPRTLYYGAIEVFGDAFPKAKRYLTIGSLVVFYGIISTVILFFFMKNFGSVIDAATIIAFLTAPIMAAANLLVVLRKDAPDAAKPNKFMLVFGILGLLFLTAFSILFIWIKFFAS